MCACVCLSCACRVYRRIPSAATRITARKANKLAKEQTHAHTHTHKHIHTRAHTHKHTHTHKQAHTHKETHTHKHTQRHTHTSTHKHTHTHTHTLALKAGTWESSRGKPSMRRRKSPFASLARRTSSSCSTSTVISVGIRPPSFMIALMVFERSVSLATSARNKSPVEMCVKLKSLASRAHCVPLPEPGPPMTKTA